MLIREARSNDLPGIISVLKASLGEENLPLSEEIWKYKHEDNPHGKSLVLVAEEDEKIAGVRAFMRWRWQMEEKIYSAYRAVDTATHPHFQGKGIFKKLTLKAVEIGTQDHFHLVFNTPNNKSRPGYLKMGWREVGKLRVGIEPAWNSFYKIKKNKINYSIVNQSSASQLDLLCRDWNQNLEKKKFIFTPKAPDYLFWRYEKNPLQEYEVLKTPDLYLAAYVKKRQNVKELRIAECILRNNITYKVVQKVVRKWCNKFGTQVITYSPDSFSPNIASLNGNFGPILTIRKLDFESKKFEIMESLDKWRYSLGDLELF